MPSNRSKSKLSISLECFVLTLFRFFLPLLLLLLLPFFSFNFVVSPCTHTFTLLFIILYIHSTLYNNLYIVDRFHFPSSSYIEYLLLDLYISGVTVATAAAAAAIVETVYSILHNTKQPELPISCVHIGLNTQNEQWRTRRIEKHKRYKNVRVCVCVVWMCGYLCFQRIVCCVFSHSPIRPSSKTLLIYIVLSRIASVSLATHMHTVEDCIDKTTIQCSTKYQQVHIITVAWHVVCQCMEHFFLYFCRLFLHAAELLLLLPHTDIRLERRTQNISNKSDATPAHKSEKRPAKKIWKHRVKHTNT